MDDRVYVIYRNGKRYDQSGRKIAYLTRGAAKGVITSDAEEIARQKYGLRTWWDLPREERKRLAKQVAEEEFEIVEYVPVPKEAAE